MDLYEVDPWSDVLLGRMLAIAMAITAMMMAAIERPSDVVISFSPQ